MMHSWNGGMTWEGWFFMSLFWVLLVGEGLRAGAGVGYAVDPVRVLGGVAVAHHLRPVAVVVALARGARGRPGERGAE